MRRRPSRLARSLALPALVTATCLAIPGGLGTPAAAAPLDRHVVVFGVDGLLFDKIAPAAAPNLDALIAGGYSSKTWLYASPLAPTMSGPGWATNLTGVWPDKHGVVGNTWGSSISAYPDFLTRLEQSNPSFTTYAAVTWGPLVDGTAGPAMVTSAVDTRYKSTGDTDTTAKAVAQMTNVGPNAAFIHLDDVDHAGHSYGAASSQYLAEVADVDSQIGQIINAAKARPTYAQEEWTFMVVADHGHTDAGGHGGNTPAERSSFIIKDGPGIGQSTPALKPKNVDLAADVLSTFGVAIPAALDGQPLATASTDPFDTMVGSLQARVDETGIPSSVLGWSKSLPTGWSFDNTGMGTGGVAEWRGWSLTNDDFWTKTNVGQQRESNVRARGVFAVADSDEWADKAYSGSFNSRLRSPDYNVTGKTTATLRFGSHYLKEGNETARVQVSFGGGTPQNVLTYSGNVVAKLESVNITIPPGTTSMKVIFSLTNGVNNWYWAVDNPTLTFAP